METCRNGKRGLFLAFTLVLTNSSLSLHLPVRLRLWSRQDVDKPLTCPPSPSSLLPPSLLSPPPSSHPSISLSRGAAFRSELMDLRWRMHSSSGIPSSAERRVVSKKKDDIWDRETWSDRSEPPWRGRRVTERERCSGAQAVDMSFDG